jgi:hypothetical protein
MSATLSASVLAMIFGVWLGVSGLCHFQEPMIKDEASVGQQPAEVARSARARAKLACGRSTG